MHKESEVFVVVLPHVSMCGFNAAWVQDMGILCTAIRPTDRCSSIQDSCMLQTAVFYCAVFCSSKENKPCSISLQIIPLHVTNYNSIYLDGIVLEWFDFQN